MTIIGKGTALFPIGEQSAGWISSVLFHVTLVLGALVFTQHLTLAPHPAPFTWNVAMVEPISSDHEHHSATVSSVGSASTPDTVTPSPVLSHENSPPITKRDGAPHPQSLQPSPTIPSSSSLSSHDIQRGGGLGSYAQPMTPPLASKEAVAEEPTVPREIEQPSVSSQAATKSLPRQESSPQNYELPSLSSASTSQQFYAAQPTVSDLSDAESDSKQQRTAMASVPSSSPPDYTWLSETILRRIQEFKRYPAEARLDRAEGKVILKAVVRSDGSVDDVEVYQSSGLQTLDHAAVELLKRATPFQLPRPLGKPQMTVKIPMNYRLEQ